jgi:hypothetical protein
MSWPSLAQDPVSGHINPILTASAAKAAPAMRHKTADKQSAFFMEFLLLLWG